MSNREKRYEIKFRISFFLILIIICQLTFSLQRTAQAVDKNTASDCIDGKAESLPLVEDLLKYVKKNQLYNDEYWWTLLHYKKTLFGQKSLIDDPEFFLSPEGKTNPQAELEATIRAFFNEDSTNTEEYICKFIARYTWLKSKLEFDFFIPPRIECTKFEEFLKRINPSSAILAFPTSHMNSPASMFGHTLLIINTGYESKLVSYAINYSASSNETNGFVFAFKGIFGFYEGYFSIMPYYEKLQEYNDIDQRDIWEYHLNFNREEIIRMLMALWEMENMYSYYYFFDENCSYTLLFLLEAARPSLHLTDQFRPWVMPIDTVKVVLTSGIVTSVNCRISKASRIKYMASLMNEKSQNLALDILEGTITPPDITDQNLSLTEKARILDLVTENLQYRYSKKDLSKDEYAGLFLETLSSRSKLGNAAEIKYETPVLIPPEKGHDSNRFSIGLGIREDSLFQEINLRPAYHELIDDDDGYLPGSQIEFCNISLRYYSNDDNFDLESFDLVNIVSLSARDKFFKPISWKVGAGMTEGQIIPDDSAGILSYFEVGGGFAYKNDLFGLCYILAETDMNFGKSLNNGYAIGWGGTIGLLKDINEYWKIHLFSRNIYYTLGDRHGRLGLALCQQIKLSKNNSLILEFAGKKASETYQREAKISWNYFFK